MRRRIALSLLLVAGAAVAGGEGVRTLWPTIQAAKPETQCVADPAVMRRSHMEMLKHQRDDTVHGGIRGAKASLKACVECHASRDTRSVAQGANDFCVSCHSYAAVKIDCFECHASRPAGAVKLAAGEGAAQ